MRRLTSRHRERVLEAVRVCPKQAISIVEE